MMVMRLGTANRILTTGALLALALLALALLGRNLGQSRAVGPASGVPPGLAQLPVQFEPNVGQSDLQARFVARAPGSTLLFAPSGVAMSLSLPAPSAGAQAGASQDGQQATWPEQVLAYMSFVGSSRTVRIAASGELTGKANYFIGNDPAHWHADLPTYASIVYRGLYKGVDLSYAGHAGQLKGTLMLAAGADPRQIAWTYPGAGWPSVDGAGNLVVGVRPAGGQAPVMITELRPVAWQQVDGQQVAVSARYRVAADGSVGFVLGPYDKTRRLTIDPTVTYGSYLGGAAGPSAGAAVTSDPGGNFYIMGQTGAANFPVTPGAYQTTYAGANDSFIAKFRPDGSLAYATYLGGSGQEGEMLADGGIAVDGEGDAIVAGSTASSDFPTTANALQRTYGGANDAFLAKLDPGGSALLYSTYLGGSCADYGYSVAVDPAGNAYVGGTTCSSNFPVVQPRQPYRGSYDGFIAKFASNNTAIYSTWLGGAHNESVYGLAADGQGNAYAGGKTDSDDFPTVSPIQPARGGYQDAFLSKISPAGSALLYSTYLGGNQPDTAEGVAVDTLGQAYVTGFTYSTNFPTHNSLQGYGGQEDAFVTKVNSAGSALLFSTFLGGSNSDDAHAIALDPVQNIYVAGTTLSTDFPLTNPFRSQHGNSASDGFVTKYAADRAALAYSSYLGGYNADARGVAADAAGNAYITGQARTDLPITANAVQPSPPWGNGDAYALRVFEAIPSVTSMPTASATSTPAAATPTGVSTATPSPAPSSTPTPVAPCNIEFPDVPPGNPFYPYVHCLACRGIISGYADGMFHPGNNMTRGQISKVVSSAADFQDPIPSDRQTYEDVPAANPFWLWIERLTLHGVISGYRCGGPGEPCVPPLGRSYFRWGNDVTRGQLSKIVSNAANVQDPVPPGQQTFEDVPAANPFWLWIERLASRGVIGGYNCGGPGEPCVPPLDRPYFRPFNPVTRGQAAKIVANTFYPGCQAP